MSRVSEIALCVIPAKAGIQAESADVRKFGLDSRVRGNDVVGFLALSRVGSL